MLVVPCDKEELLLYISSILQAVSAALVVEREEEDTGGGNPDPGRREPQGAEAPDTSGAATWTPEPRRQKKIQEGPLPLDLGPS